MQKYLREIAQLRAYAPLIIIALVVLLLAGSVASRRQSGYTNKYYGYSLKLPKGWLQGKSELSTATFFSEDLLPGSHEPEASVVVSVQERFEHLDLSTHFNAILKDLALRNCRVLNQGVSYVGTAEARWVEFQDPNGIDNHVWYVVFNGPDKLIIVQNRVANTLVKKYQPIFRYILDNFKTQSS